MRTEAKYISRQVPFEELFRKLRKQREHEDTKLMNDHLKKAARGSCLLIALESLKKYWLLFLSNKCKHTIHVLYSFSFISFANNVATLIIMIKYLHINGFFVQQLCSH